MIQGTLRRPKTVLVVATVLLAMTILPVQWMVLGEEIVLFPQIGS
jgi:hypothetical protein